MDTRLFLTLNNIANTLEQVTKSFEQQSIRNKTDKDEALKSVNTTRSILALQESISQNLRKNNELLNTQQQIVGLMRNQIGALNFPMVAPITPNVPTIGKVATNPRFEPTAINQPKLNEIVVPIKYITSDLPQIKMKSMEIPLVYGKAPVLDPITLNKMIVPVELGKLPDIKPIQLPNSILPLQIGKMPDIKYPEVKITKIPIEWNEITKPQIPKFDTEPIILKYGKIQEPTLPKISLPDITQKINYSPSKITGEFQPKEVNVPVNYVPNQKKVDVSWNIQDPNIPTIKPIDIQSRITTPTLTNLTNVSPITVPVKYGTLPKLETPTTLKDTEIPLKVSSIGLVNDIQNVKNQIKSENLQLNVGAEKVQNINQINDMNSNLKSLSDSLTKFQTTKVDTTMTSTTNFLGDFFKKLNSLDDSQLQNKFIGLSKSFDVLNESTKNLNTNFEIAKLSNMKTVSTTPMIMSMIDNSQFNKLIDKLEQNSKIVQSVIENSGKNFVQQNVRQTSTEVAQPVIKMEKVQPEGSSTKTFNDLYDVMKNFDGKLSVMIQSITNLTSTLENNRNETHLKPYF
jgi:hypothetical protein